MHRKTANEFCLVLRMLTTLEARFCLIVFDGDHGCVLFCMLFITLPQLNVDSVLCRMHSQCRTRPSGWMPVLLLNAKSWRIKWVGLRYVSQDGVLQLKNSSGQSVGMTAKVCSDYKMKWVERRSDSQGV